MALSFLVANIAVLVLAFSVFNFLHSLSQEIETVIREFDTISLKTEDVRVSAISILKHQRKILGKRPTIEMLEEISNLSERFTGELKSLEELYKDTEGKKIIVQMISYVESLKVVLSKTSLFHRDSVGFASIGELFDKILESFSEFQDIHYYQNVERNTKLKGIINEVKKNMMITLIISFFATILLGLVVPGKIALPFKKIKDTIRELQECNFDVSIYYAQEDEIGEIAREMNKMIHGLKIFEELRTDRISVEKRKFDVLANMMKRPVLVANASGMLIYMNNQLYSLLQVQMEDVIGKVMTETVIPSSIIESYNLAIKRRSKIENAEIIIRAKNSDILAEELTASSLSASLTPNTSTPPQDILDVADEGKNDDVAKCQNDIIFEGYANVIPIRGKDSSLDYYLMVLSSEVFV